MLNLTQVLFIACASSFLIVAGEVAGQRKYPHHQDEYNSEPSSQAEHQFSNSAKLHSHSDGTTGEYIGYRAAALQYQSFDDISGGGLAALKENAKEYIKYIKEASAEGAQIFVFPEHGLTGLVLGPTLGEYLPQTQVVPEPENKEVPCDYLDVPDSSLIMKNLSCAALENHIYLVVCLAEQFNCSQVLSEDESYLEQSVDANALPSGCEFYNTQVVFDDTGAVIARYRKKNLHIEEHFIPGTDPDSSAIFETSFGVTFTLMGAQILVFPEHGLTGLILGSTLGEYLPQTQVVPDPENKEVPCDYLDVPDSSLIMKNLSCAALENHIYLVVCLAEQFNCSQVLSEDESYLEQSVDANVMPNGCEFYDTQTVFDDTGAVVARYRKKHLFIEDHFIEGTDPDSSAMFATSFGATFTLMISFDLLFYDPAVSNMETFGVRDVITSSGWMDQLPFLVAPQIWKGFSEGYHANLIAANHYNPMEGFLGAGIFRGVSSDPEEYTYDTSSGTKLIIGDVLTHTPVSPRKISTSRRSERALSHNTAGQSSVHIIKNKDSVKQDSQEIVTGKSTKRNEKMTEVNMHQKYKHEILDHYDYVILNKSESAEPVRQTLINSQNFFACIVTYSYPPGGSEDFLYMLISYTGLTEHGNFTYFLYNENCAVVLCLNENIDSCAQIEGAYLGDSTFRPYELQGYFNGHYIYPAILTDSVQLFNPAWWNYSLVQEENNYRATITIHEEVNDVLTLGLYSRLFSEDPETMP